eukprot:TRINITY_DN106153_c0_g1_i1.p1 TRINITY_DN106153_c0_g1~~TRINITY_DN106153_c0_g1_i1.p1  ORF type:complete len:304 (-),score=2.17 TRINITY_DN106153_c0_g1_i1:64-975(-)
MMKTLLLALIFTSISCSLVVTKEYNDYLKAHVSWEVTPYEENIFLGWTEEEVAALLTPITTDSLSPLSKASSETPKNLPKALSWETANCIHAPRNQGNCASSWAFAFAGMLSDRCCLSKRDHGWLSVQELLSCDTRNHGCSGGWPVRATRYVSENGLVHDACYPYEARDVPCPYYCQDAKDWYDSHVCICKNARRCLGPPEMKECLKTGPIVATMGVCKSFLHYRSGIYTCDCERNYMGQQSVTILGYNDNPECHWIVRNSWGTQWGTQGRFMIMCGTCGIDGEWDQGNVSCDIASQCIIDKG